MTNLASAGKFMPPRNSAVMAADAVAPSPISRTAFFAVRDPSAMESMKSGLPSGPANLG